MKILLFMFTLLVIVTSCDRVDPTTNIDTIDVPVAVVKYLQQADSLCHDSIITSGRYDYVIKHKHIVARYDLEYDTVTCCLLIIIMLLLIAVLAFAILL